MSLFKDNADDLVLGQESYTGCAHKTTRVVHGPFGPHIAKKICLDCGSFCGWCSKLDIAITEAKAKLGEIRLDV